MGDFNLSDLKRTIDYFILLGMNRGIRAARTGYAVVVVFAQFDELDSASLVPTSTAGP